MSATITTLGENVVTQKGFAFKSAWFCDTGRQIVKVKDFTADSVDPSEVTHVSTEIAERHLKYELRTGDVVVQTVGSWPSAPASVVGKCVRIPRTVDCALLNQNAVRLSPSGRLDGGFLYYSLKNPAFGEYIVGTAQGAASQAAITLEAIRAYKLNLPDLPTQRKIAGILSAYDDLIENNLRRIKILEQMAQSLYREWFVHFRFPGHESATFKDSELGRIPEGWEVRAIGDFGNVLTGKTPSKANEDFYGEDVPFLKTPDMHGQMFILRTNEYLSTLGAQSQAKKTLPIGSICVSCIGTIGVVSITTEPCQTNQQINSVALHDETSREFLFFWLREAKQLLENLGSNGATMGNVNKSKFEGMKLVRPSSEDLAKYHKYAEPMFCQIEQLFRKIQTLRRTRDLLLPKLLSPTNS